MVTAFRAAIFLDVAIRPWPLKLNAEDAATIATGLNKLGVWGKVGSFVFIHNLLNGGGGFLSRIGGDHSYPEELDRRRQRYWQNRTL
jgi:hypothetical protein